MTLHIVDPISRVRAELARMAFDLGYHAEVYADLKELAMRPPPTGLVLMNDDRALGGIASLMDQMTQYGIWLPVVATGEAPQPGEVVKAMKAGVLDYLVMPVDTMQLDFTLARLNGEAQTYVEARRKLVEARSRLAGLSRRESEVLELLARGSSNKVIARELEISPRTVEIHRANMMTKLGARHAAEAVRVKLEAQLQVMPSAA